MKKSVITSIVVVAVIVIVVLTLGITGQITGGQPVGCSDTDNGKDYFVQGSISYENRDTIYTDYCYKDKWVNEYYCFGERIRSERKLCDSQVCVDGACIE